MSATPKKSVTKKNTIKKTVTKKSLPGKRSIKKASVKTKLDNNKIIDNEDRPKIQEKENGQVMLASVLTINDAKKLQEDLEAILTLNDEVLIDASLVEMIDTAMLQLLLAFSEKIKSKRKKFSWANPSQCLLDRAETLNMSEKLGLGVRAKK